MKRGGAVVALLAGVALLAPWLAPYDPDQVIDVAGSRYLAPGSTRQILTLRDGRSLAVTGLRVSGDHLFYKRGDLEAAVPASELAHAPHPRRFLLGTDGFGRDLLSRLLFGARVSLTIGLLAVALGVALGAGLGATCGYAGGLADASLMRLVDVLHAVPRFFLFVICAALFGPSTMLLILVLGATGWMGIARLTRGQVLSLRERGYVEAARALGGGSGTIVTRHLLPQCAATVAVSAALMAADTILAEASLSFLGLGVQPPAASWGNIIASGRDSLISAWWISAFPGLAIVATAMALHAAGRQRVPGRPGSDGGAAPPLLD